MIFTNKHAASKMFDRVPTPPGSPNIFSGKSQDLESAGKSL